MNHATAPLAAAPRFQFSLRAMFQFVTLCSLLAALSPLVGMVASAVLMLLALAIWARAGWLAMGLLLALMMVENYSLSIAMDPGVVVRLLLTTLIAWLIALWYGRQARKTRPASTYIPIAPIRLPSNNVSTTSETII